MQSKHGLTPVFFALFIFLEETIMAYRHRATQLSFQSFNNGLGVPLSSDNEWVQLADMLPWQ
ncbi:hypothetical protein LCA32G_0711, partial [Lacticaseibacillus paracasei]